MTEDQEQAVKTRGYQLWQESGAAHGHDREDWMRAEREIQTAEQVAQCASVNQTNKPRQSSVGILPYTPIALFFMLAESWVASGTMIVGMMPWSPWTTRVG